MSWGKPDTYLSLTKGKEICHAEPIKIVEYQSSRGTIYSENNEALVHIAPLHIHTYIYYIDG